MRRSDRSRLPRARRGESRIPQPIELAKFMRSMTSFLHVNEAVVRVVKELNVSPLVVIGDWKTNQTEWEEFHAQTQMQLFTYLPRLR